MPLIYIILIIVVGIVFFAISMIFIRATNTEVKYLKTLEEQLELIDNEIKQVREELKENKTLKEKLIGMEKELKENNERIKLLEQNYRFTENLLEDGKTKNDK